MWVNDVHAVERTKRSCRYYYLEAKRARCYVDAATYYTAVFFYAAFVRVQSVRFISDTRRVYRPLAVT